MNFFKRKNIDSFDRVLLDLTGTGYRDDQITVRDIHENLFVCGSTGTGKTSTIGYHLAKVILDKNELSDEDKFGMILFLYKSADAQQWIEWAEAAGRVDDLIIINEQTENLFNIMESYADKEALSIVETLMVLNKLTSESSGTQSSEEFWNAALKTRLHRLVLLNKLCGLPLNIMTLYRLHHSAPNSDTQMDDVNFQANSLCWKMIVQAGGTYGAEHEEFQLVEEYFIREMPTLNDRTQSSILAMCSALLSGFINSPMLKRLFCGTTEKPLAELLRGKIVLLDLPIQKLDHSAKIAQILLKHVLQKAIEERDLSEIPNPVLMWIDEYQHFITPYDFLYMSTARSSRGGMILMTQNVSNIQASIGGDAQLAKVRMNSLMALCNTKIFLAQNDAMITNPYASNLMGKGLRMLPGSSVNMREFGGNASISSTYEHLVLPHEFSMLKTGGNQHGGIVEAYVTATGKRFSNGQNHLLVEFRQPWFK